MTYIELNQEEEDINSAVADFIANAVRQLDGPIELEGSIQIEEYKVDIVNIDEGQLTIHFKEVDPRTNEKQRPWVARVYLDINIGVIENLEFIPLHKVAQKEDLLSKFKALVDKDPDLASRLLEKLDDV